MHNGQSLSELELNEKLLVTNRIIIELEILFQKVCLR